jgi:hypothetical protein
MHAFCAAGIGINAANKTIILKRGTEYLYQPFISSSEIGTDESRIAEGQIRGVVPSRPASSALPKQLISPVRKT